MTMKPQIASSLLLSLLILAGCAGLDQKPQAKIADANQLAAGATLEHVAVAPAAWPATDWWKRFGDAQLDQLEDEALAGNPSLRQAQARVRKAAAFAEAS